MALCRSVFPSNVDEARLGMHLPGVIIPQVISISHLVALKRRDPRVVVVSMEPSKNAYSLLFGIQYQFLIFYPHPFS